MNAFAKNFKFVFRFLFFILIPNTFATCVCDISIFVRQSESEMSFVVKIILISCFEFV